jgi:hypothetical protein
LFAKRYGIRLDWLIAGIGDTLSKHLTNNRGGRIAILPLSSTPESRQLAYRVAARALE